MSTEEHVMVVPTELFHRLGHFQGFNGDVERYLPILLDPANTQYRPRSLMEQDPTYKQLIPYVIFRHQPAAESPRYFHYTRGHGQGERRLHAKLSVGVGGHISTQDVLTGDAYAAGMQRELDEEIEFAEPLNGGPSTGLLEPQPDAQVADPDFRPATLGQIIGLINDDSNDVGQVHLGIVHLVDLSRPWVRAREKDLLDAGFSAADQLQLRLEEFETWSQIALQYLESAGHNPPPGVGRV
jgi:predicted NUDIX family phosphoesterase